MNHGRHPHIAPAHSRFARGIIVVLAIFLFLIGKEFKFNSFWGNDVLYLSVARHIFNPAYLTNNTFIGAFDYLLLYGYTVGPLVEFFGAKTAAIISGIFICFAFAVVFYRLGKSLNLNLLLIVAVCQFYIQFPSIAAGDYMIGGAEAKTFAYIGIMVFLLLWASRRYAPAFAFLGLACSFHPVTVFACVTFVLTYFSFRQNWHTAKIKEQLINSGAFWLTALPGLYSHGRHYAATLTHNAADAATDWEIAKFRWPHHISPDYWPDTFYIPLVALTFVCLTVSIIEKDKSIKFLSRFGFCSSFFFYTGLLSFYFGFYAPVKIQIFRLPDTFLPFIGWLLLFYYLNKLWHKHIPPLRYSEAIYHGLVILGLSFLVIRTVGFRAPEIFNSWTATQQQGVYHYIRNQTDKDALFLVNPELSDFWAGAGRAAFAIFKYAPTYSGEAQQAWYDRLIKINGGKPQNIGFDAVKEISANYQRMTPAKVRRLAVDYSVDYFLITADSSQTGGNFSFPIAYADEHYILYRTNTQCEDKEQQ